MLSQPTLESGAPWFGYRPHFNVIYSLAHYNTVMEARCVVCHHTLSDMANWGADYEKCLNGKPHIFK